MKKKGIVYALFTLLALSSMVTMIDAGRSRYWGGRRYGWNRGWRGRRWGWGRPYLGFGYPYYYGGYGFPGIGFSIGF